MENLDAYLSEQAAAAKAAMRRCTAEIRTDVAGTLGLPFLARHPSLGLVAVTVGGFVLGHKKLRRRALALMTAAPLVKGLSGALGLLGQVGVGAVRRWSDRGRESSNGSARS